MFRRRPLFFGIVLLALLLAIAPPACRTASAVTMEEGAEAMDHYFVPAFPLVYGEILDSLDVVGAGNVKAVMTGCDVIGYLKSMGDIAIQIESGKNSKAALNAGLLAANVSLKLLGEMGVKQIVVAGTGVGLLPLNALVTAIAITQQSYEAVEASKTALDLEVLYYTIESDPVLRDRDRELGEGDPIKKDAEAVEHLWRKVINTESWRELFKTYVTSELGVEWPEPSLWDRITVSSDFLDEDALIQEKKRLQSHIAGLLAELNKVAKKREAEVVVAQRMKALAAVAGKIDPGELKKAFSNYLYAMKQLPDIQAYVDTLPQLIETYRQKIDKATAMELSKLRLETIPDELGVMSQKAMIVRYIPTVGRDATKRQEILKALQKGYGELIELRGTASAAEINTRLAKEAEKLTVDGSEFTFKRHECPKDFYDFRDGIEREVKSGALAKAVSEARQEARQNLEDVKEAYGEDYKEQEEIYTDKHDDILDQIKEVEERLAQTTDTNERNSLYNTLNSLKDKKLKLENHFTTYKKLFSTSSSVDIMDCENVIEDIERFITDNQNRYATIQQSLQEFYSDAMNRSFAFQRDHGTGGARTTEGFLSGENLENLRRIIAEESSKADYAYMDISFLKDYLRDDPEKAASVNVQQTVTDMHDAGLKYVNSIFALRRTYYTSWDTWTIPCLEYMTSARSTDDIDRVVRVIDDAIDAYQDIDTNDLTEAYKPRYQQELDFLHNTKKGMEGYRELRSKASGLAGQLSAYNAKALEINRNIDIDGPYLFDIVQRFSRAKLQFQFMTAIYYYETGRWNPRLSGPPPMLLSDRIATILDDAGLLILSRKLGFGIEALVATPFVDVSGPSGMLSLRVDDFKALTSAVKRFPTDSFSSYMAAFHSMREEEGPQGYLMELYFQRPGDFVSFFQFNELFAKAAADLVDALAVRKAAALKAQEAIDREKALFDIMLGKVQKAVSAAQSSIDRGDYVSVFGITFYRDDLGREYDALGKRRADIDEAFALWDRLIEEAKEKDAARGAEEQEAERRLQQAIRDFYGDFKSAYESRDAYQVMGLLSDEWSAGDGTTLDDLEDNLTGSFRLFDDIQYRLENLRLQPLPGGRYLVNYNVIITSRIYSRNLVHEEKSTVNEEVSFDSGGTVRISRTLSGRFWTD